MKKAFDAGSVVTAAWISGTSNDGVLQWADQIGYPIVSKHHFGSRGKGNTLIKTKQQLQTWLTNHTLSNYIFEKYHDYNREYRLHITKDGCFYTNRKMLKTGTPPEQRWYRNDSNCTWILETNPSFNKPKNWADIVDQSVKALKAVGLDVGAVDVKVQSAKDDDGSVRQKPKFIIIEINSAPSFGDGTLVKYLDEIPKILKSKKEQFAH